MHTSVIIPAAGTGKRFNTDIPKQFTLLNDIPIIIHTLKLFNDNPQIHSIIIAAAKDQIEYMNLLVNKYGVAKVKDIVCGGNERHFSVQAALDTSCAANADIILIHDAVRPFTSETLVNAVINTASRFGAAIPVLIPKDTIKLSSDDNTISSTLDRKKLRAAQTPQGFKRDIIFNAYQFAQTNNIQATDDASVVEAGGGIVHCIEGEENNFKITTQLDFSLAQIICQQSLSNATTI